MQEELKREMLDDEGENLALRSFLMQYSCDRSITVSEMARHMRRSGWESEYWPPFARMVNNAGSHLTKAGAQIWIRHLIGLERRTPVSGEVAEIPVGARIGVLKQATGRGAVVAYDVMGESGKVICTLPPDIKFPAQGIDHAKLEERAAFEAWARPMFSLEQFPDGIYKNTAAYAGWKAWQARGQQADDKEDRLLRIIAYAYQVAGAHDASEHILDVLAGPEAATDEQVEAMLPYVVQGQQAGGVESFAVIPRRMTDAMRDAGNEILLDRCKLNLVWSAMLDSAPSIDLNAFIRSLDIGSGGNTKGDGE